MNFPFKPCRYMPTEGDYIVELLDSEGYCVIGDDRKRYLRRNRHWTDDQVEDACARHYQKKTPEGERWHQILLTEEAEKIARDEREMQDYRARVALEGPPPTTVAKKGGDEVKTDHALTYYAAHREERQAKARDYYAKHREELREKHRAYWAALREVTR